MRWRPRRADAALSSWLASLPVLPLLPLDISGGKQTIHRRDALLRRAGVALTLNHFAVPYFFAFLFQISSSIACIDLSRGGDPDNLIPAGTLLPRRSHTTFWIEGAHRGEMQSARGPSLTIIRR